MSVPTASGLIDNAWTERVQELRQMVADVPTKPECLNDVDFYLTEFELIYTDEIDFVRREFERQYGKVPNNRYTVK